VKDRIASFSELGRLEDFEMNAFGLRSRLTLGLAAALRINKGIVSFLLVVGCYKNNIRRTVALKRDAPYGRGLILVSPFKDYFWVVAYQRFQSICLVSEEKVDIFGGYGKIQTF
jgi:hypothetical protein